jgi:3-oxoadipate enol-lactonase
MNMIQVGDVGIHYRALEINSDKPVIAFVNSLGTDFRIWDEIVDRLRGEFAFVLYDKRGHGLSDRGSKAYSIDLHASDLIDILGKLRISRAVIWGLSVGGLIAQTVAAKRPDLVRALTLSNTACRLGSPEMWQFRIDTIRQHGISHMVEPIMKRWFTPAFRDGGHPLYAACWNMLSLQPPDGYSGTCEAIRDADLVEIAPTITVPTLCIAGDQDLASPSEPVRALAALIPNSECAEIASCGHLPCIEQPGAYAACATSFLNSLTEQ